MKLQEFKEAYKEKMDEATLADIEKVVQGESDAIRTEYSGKLKDLEQYKPKEKTDEQIELEKAKQELAQFKFEKTVKDKGLNADLAKYLKSDVDLDEFSKFYSANSNHQEKEYVPSTHSTDAGLSKDKFKNMSYAEKSKLYTENPALYQQMTTN